MAILEIKNLTKKYGHKIAVNDLSLQVEPGDIYGFIGKNGAGKTTTIRSAVGILDFNEGEIFVDGHSIASDPVACKTVTAYIPDNPDLYDYLTGIQYLNFIADIFKIPTPQREERIKTYSDELELTEALGDLISTYSHGMKQKLALISAFIHQPKLLILDEPFVGLDPEASFKVKGLMKKMAAEGGAIFFSTHVLEVAQQLCNKIAIIVDGKLLASGKTEDVRGDGSLEDVFMGLVAND